MSPEIWEKTPLKCINCSNRGRECEGTPHGTRCKDCKRGGMKCSRANTASESIALFDKIRPHWALTPDGMFLLFLFLFLFRLRTQANYLFIC